MAQPGRKAANDRTPEALYGHCVDVYRMMLSEARTIVGPEGEMVIWEGQLTNLIISKCNLSTPYYTHVTRKLKAMECIRMIKRGGGTAPSQWELMREPALEVYEKINPRKQLSHGPYAQVLQQIQDLNTRVKVLEKALEKIIDEETHND